MSTLKLFLFGGMRVYRSDCPDEINLTPVLKSLLAFLVLNRHRSFQRETLMEMFWGDMEESRASSCLSTALWRLRVAIEADRIVKGSYLLSNRQGHEVRFNPESDFWLDTTEFEDHAKQLSNKKHALTREALEQMENGLLHYNSGILNGIYDDWAMCEHERFHNMYIQMLNNVLGRYSEKHDFAKCIHYARVLLDQDPLREDIHRILMSLFMESGQRSLAIRQYHKCKTALINELQITPDAKTEALFTKIIAVHAHQEERKWIAKDRSRKGSERSEIVELIRQTHETIDDLQRQLQLMVLRIDHYMENSE